ncbi:hypothetical protein [Rhodococcoides yunnanense]|uniref:hypothetical protein n=1 Tax=Rhodococcoides yunnanense TaxID=278209 RepID=UPI0022B0B552|nr:hypothetical protein [Rhodococcus yunnanensis]MCZ4277434.1 hypothetical protein [Rhodococcus yunnanensis]
MNVIAAARRHNKARETMYSSTYTEAAADLYMIAASTFYNKLNATRTIIALGLAIASFSYFAYEIATASPSVSGFIFTIICVVIIVGLLTANKYSRNAMHRRISTNIVVTREISRRYAQPLHR